MENDSNTSERKKPPLIALEGVEVALQGKRALSGLSWRLQPGEHWAVIGGNGAGKSTFFRLLRGDIWPDAAGAGRRLYCFDGEAQESPLGITRRIGLVSAELHEAYLKNRWDMTGEEVITTGFFDSAWLHQEPDEEQAAFAGELIRLLHLGPLAHKRILEMSLGEARRVLIARALAGKPRVLMLDEFCNGLDIPSRQRILRTVETIARAGTQILYATHRTEELVPSITHLLLMKEGRIVAQGGKEEVLIHEEIAAFVGRPAFAAPAREPGRPDREPPRTEAAPPCLITVTRASVYLRHKKILHDVTWRMNTGENWAILGRNGAGKSTLLKLITGDIYPALGGEVHRFGTEEPESLKSIRKRIGVVSPDLHIDHCFSLTGREVVESGFFSSVGLYDTVSDRQKAVAQRWIAFFRLDGLAGKEITALSYGERRKLFIARALVNGPDILILDEPFSGLDSAARAVFGEMIEHISRDTATRIILVTHHLDELVPSITHVMIMDEGRIVAQGGKDEMLKEKTLAAYFGEG